MPGRPLPTGAPELRRKFMDSVSVLLVDDEKDFNETIAKRLRRRGYGVRSAFSGQEALAILPEGGFDVVVLDMKMPGMDGIETLREIKKRHSSVEVLLLTGHASVESGVQGMAMGAYDYLLKPVEFEELLSAINQAGERKRLNSQHA